MLVPNRRSGTRLVVEERDMPWVVNLVDLPLDKDSGHFVVVDAPTPDQALLPEDTGVTRVETAAAAGASFSNHFSQAGSMFRWPINGPDHRRADGGQ